MTDPIVAVLTIVHGRHDHLVGMLRGLLAGSVTPDVLVVVAMDDAQVSALVAEVVGDAIVDVRVIEQPRVDGRLPLAAARNAAARAAVDAGASVLVFLDVDCIPGAALVERYRRVAAPVAVPRIWAGAVHYLAPPADGSVYTATELAESAPHPARSVAPDGEVLREPDVRLFWSLSFAVTVADWQTIGGFDERYTGYGGEDTDVAMRLDHRGGELWWVGGAPAYHQWHPVEDPPRSHLADIVRNSAVFEEQWGHYPMGGWLEAFEAEGLVTRAAQSPTWHLTPAGRRAAHSD